MVQFLSKLQLFFKSSLSLTWITVAFSDESVNSAELVNPSDEYCLGGNCSILKESGYLIVSV